MFMCDIIHIRYTYIVFNGAVWGEILIYMYVNLALWGALALWGDFLALWGDFFGTLESW